MFTSHTKIRRWLAALLVLAMMIGVLPVNATAVYATGTSPSQIPETVTVEKTHPEGITINLFDYWLEGKESQDDSNPADYRDLGINKNHTLKFGKGMDTVLSKEADDPNENKTAIENALAAGNINAWTNGARPMAGIVASTLDADGYPVLNASLGSESLGYLFNTSSGDGKEAYLNVGGLLQQHQDGYFYYNSQENFAEFDSSEKLFTLYAEESVNAAGASPAGQFFPFNTAEEVFVDSEVDSTDEVINHYFGMHMTTSFQQTPGGMSPSDEDEPVTFSFSGDDDVWVYIDDVLVADLGGIHDACSVEINFSTGKIYVFKDKAGGDRGEGYYDKGTDTLYNAASEDDVPTLKKMYKAAGKENSVEWKGDTFADESYHTFDFFYLERGNTDSNMRMRHNIQTVPESELLKIDQDGKPVAGAKYVLYETDQNYKVLDGAAPIATGTTDTKGVFTFKNTDGETLPLNDLKKDGYYLLVEETVPEGYRSGTEPIELRVETASNGNKKLLLSANAWDTGAYAMPMVRVSATTDGDGNIQNQNSNSYNAREGGLIVAAIFKGEDVKYGETSPDGLNLVYGDPVKGWKTAEGDSAAEQLQAVAKTGEPGIYDFSLDSSGAYSADIEHLPGDINDYSWMVNDKNSGGDTNTAQFMGAYFFVEDAESISDIETTGKSKIHLLNSDGFIRDFSMRLYAPNIENRLLVQKVIDGTTTPVDGAKFKLYEQKDITVDDVTGEYTSLGNDNPVTVEKVTNDGKTGDVTLDGYGEAIHGALAFYGIPEGAYYLVETSAPDHLNVNKQAIPVIVDDTGVHVNAGDADDSVSVNLGVGKIVKSMVQFATNDGIDATLHDITATLQSAKAYDSTAPADTDWTDVMENDETVSMNLSYSTEATVLEYGPTTAGGPTSLRYDSDWGRLNITQNDEAVTSENGSTKQALGDDQSLNNLFSGTVMVTVGDKLKDPGNLSITKKVVSNIATDKSKEFTIKLTLGKDGLKNGQMINSATGEPISFVDNVATLAIKDNETINLKVPNGVTLTVSEQDPGSDFDVSYKLGDQDQNAPISITSEENTANQITITNTRKDGSYTVLDGSAKLGFTKKVNNEWPEGASFTFAIDGENDAPMPAQTTVTLNKPTAGNETTGAFDDITFTEAGTYVYTISETAGENENISYDTSQYMVTVQVVADASTGELKIDSVSYTKDGEAVDSIAFTNTYTAPDGPPIDPEEPTDPDNPEPDTPALDKVNHFLYVEGYPEDYRTGEYSDNEDLWPVKPQGNITRAEVATIFYRLLKDEVREEIETDVNSFPEVNADDWFNVTVSSLANMGAISGYEDGTFRPNEPISRAELAAMAVRFYDTFEAEYEEGTFLDVDGDEWYADAIAAAEELGIIGGYPDGTVRPNNNITRAETCAIVNRVLERRPHDEHLGDVEDMRTWPDNQPGAWYYADMQEATNGHYYEWIDIDGVDFEEWTEVDKDYDWTKR